MIKRVLVLLMVLLLSTSVCFAKANEWKDSRFDFSEIKTVLLLNPVISNDVLDPFALQKTADILIPELKKLQISPQFLNPLIEQIGKDIGIDMFKLNKEDNKKYLEIMYENLPKYVDAIMVFNVYQLGWTKKYVAPTSFNYTSYQTSNVYGIGGYLGSIQTPVQRTATLDSGGYKDFATAALGITLVSTKTGDVVWGYIDNRSVRNKVLSKTSPEKQLTKIVQASFESMPLPKITKK